MGARPVIVGRYNKKRARRYMSPSLSRSSYTGLEALAIASRYVALNSPASGGVVL